MPRDSQRDTPAHKSVLSRLRLTRILGLGDDAPAKQIDDTLPRLLNILSRRLDRARDSDPEETLRLEQEIADLAISRASIATSSDSSFGAKRTTRRDTILAAALGVTLTLCLLIAYGAGYRIVEIGADNTVDNTVDKGVAIPATPGILILEGELAGATLRVLDADREELLLKIPADGARVEVAPGRVALEVSREDCADRWTRSVYFEEGSTHRFEPEICRGSGRLTIRSNVSQDRLRIDGLEFGETSKEAHVLRVGDHELRVDKPGYQPFIGTVRIQPDIDIEIRAELVAAGEAGPAQGRPMPVSKVSPTDTPSSVPSSQSFDLSDLRIPLESPGLDLESIRLPSLDDRSTYFTAAAAGSTRWHDRVSADMVSRYDLDSSGQIDQLEESEAISCRVWRDIERDFDGGGLGLSMVRYFGFDGSEWHPNALGFARSHRSAAFAKMKECGLQT